jgi:hypothetical protein
LLRPSGRRCCGDPQNTSSEEQKGLVMSTWHEKILDHERE